MDKYKWKNRILVIYTPSLNNSSYIEAVNEYFKYKNLFDNKKVLLFYKLRDTFKIYLYGLDGELKHKYNKMDVDKIINDINAMPMANY